MLKRTITLFITGKTDILTLHKITTVMKPFEYNWTTNHRALQPGDIVCIIECDKLNLVVIKPPAISHFMSVVSFKPLKISYGFRVKKLIGPAGHSFGYYALNCNNINNK